MIAEELFPFLRSLNLPQNEWVVFGGTCLAAHDIRPTNDVDIFVRPALYETLKNQGWEQKTTNSTGSLYLRKVIDGIEVQAFVHCGTPDWIPDVAAYFERPEMIGEVAFMPLDEMYAWKAPTRRPKDVEDLGLIEEYWAESP